MRFHASAAAAIALAVAAGSPAIANTAGTINLSLNVTNACVVNGASSVQTNAGALGSIAFPDQPGIFGDVDGELVGSMGALSVLCSPGVSPVLTIGAGQHDDSGGRRLRANGRDVTYRLFSDVQRSAEIAINGTISLPTATTSPTSVPIFARVNSGGQVLPAGTYALFTIPGEQEWTIIFNKTAKQWGAFKYDESQDALRVKVKPTKTAALVEQFTISADKVGTVTMAWENAQAAFTVK